MHQQCVRRPQLQLQLAQSFQERLAFDISSGTAHFDHGHLGIARPLNDSPLNLVGNVRDDLNGPSQIVTASLLAQHGIVYPARRKIIRAAHHRSGKALVMPQIQVRFGAVIGDKNLTVLERTHRARVNVNIGI